MNERPMGVTIMAWLAIVFGAFGVIGSVMALFVALTAVTIGAGAAGFGGVAPGASLAFSGILLLGWAVLLAILGVVEVVFGVGALGLKGWAWTLGVYWCYASAAFNVLHIFTSGSGVISALFSAILGVAVTVVILYYLFRPEVKMAFGKSAVETPSFLVGAFDWIDGIVNSSKAGPQTPGGMQPPRPPAAPQG